MLFWALLGVIFFLLFRTAAILIIPPIFDEVIQLYMARDITRFVNFPVYFYGQHYMGPLESYFLAPVLGVFGFSFLAARFFYQLFYVAFVAVFVAIVRRLFDRETAVYTFLLLTILPYPALHFTSIVAYEEILTLSMLALALLLRRSYFLLGFSSGLAFWCNGVSLVWFPPLGLSLIAALPAPQRRRAFLLTPAGFAAGLFPIWIHGFQTGTLIDLKGGGGRFAAASEVPGLFYLFFARMKYFLSTNIYDAGTWFAHSIRFLSIYPFALFVLTLVVFTVTSLRSFRGLDSGQRSFRFFIILAPMTLAVLYSLRNLVAEEGLRFYLPLLASYPFIVAWGIRALPSKLLKNVLLSLLVGFLAVSNAISLKWQMRDRSEMNQMVRILEENKATAGIAGMAVAYTLNAMSRERIMATPPRPEARYETVWRAVREKGPKFYIAERGANPFLEQQLEGDPGLTKAAFLRYDVYYGTSPLLEKLLGIGEMTLSS